MSKRYPNEFKEQALLKFYNRGDRSLASIAKELNINEFTLKYWVKQSQKEVLMQEDKSALRPKDWSRTARLDALQSSHMLAGEDLSSWCRSQGIFEHHLTQWRLEFCQPSNDDKLRKNNIELQSLKKKYDLLEKELNKKDKALSEAASLLLLQKKFQAFWEEKEE